MIIKLIYKAIRHIYVKLLFKIRKKEFMQFGDNLRFSPQDSFFTYESISLGNNVFINMRAYFAGEIVVGDNVLFGPNVTITGGHHDYKDVGKPIGEQGRPEKKQIIISSDTWIGTGSIILQNSRINEGVVVGAGSVVTKELPPYCICVGNPCKPIKYRYSDNELEEHLRINNKSKEEIDEILNNRRSLFKE